MKHFILGLTFSAVSSLSILAGPLVGGGGGGVQVRIQSTDGNIIALTSDQVSDVKLKDENIGTSGVKQVLEVILPAS